MAALVPGHDAGAVAAGEVPCADQPPLGLDFSRIRAEFGLPADYPAAALSEAERSIAQPVCSGRRVDATHLPLVTVDPPGAKDLDQAVLIERRPSGYRVRYAIADVAAFVSPGGALDAEVRRRGLTLYLPDGNVPLHPTLLSEQSASLLPDQVRPAVLWTIELDCAGEVVGDGGADRVDVRRAWVRSTAQLDYDGLQEAFDAGDPHPAVALLPEVGRLRREQAVHRGAIELGLPEQQVEPDGAGSWRLALRPRLLLEAFNAEISLLTGMCAAEMMRAAGIGVLRTVPEPEADTIAGLRRTAERLGEDWPATQDVAGFLARLDPAEPEALALHVGATRLLRGAGYSVFADGAPAKPHHAGIGAAYAHVTAPLRRLVDRYGAEICLAVNAGESVPDWVVDALPQLPSAMGTSERNAGQVERACLAQVQAWELSGAVGAEFGATVLRADADGGEVFIPRPPVIARCDGPGLSEGQRVRVKVRTADTVRRDVTLDVVDTTPT